MTFYNVKFVIIGCVWKLERSSTFGTAVGHMWGSPAEQHAGRDTHTLKHCWIIKIWGHVKSIKTSQLRNCRQKGRVQVPWGWLPKVVRILIFGSILVSYLRPSSEDWSGPRMMMMPPSYYQWRQKWILCGVKPSLVLAFRTQILTSEKLIKITITVKRPDTIVKVRTTTNILTSKDCRYWSSFSH